MKVLNWVHRRILNVHSCTTFLQDNEAMKEASSKIDNQKHLLLDEQGIDINVGMFDQWNEGILAIGTLAIDPLAIGSVAMTEEIDDCLQQEVINHVLDHNVNYDYDELKDDNDNDEASPLMNVEYFSHELEKVIGDNNEITEEVVENVVTKKIINEGIKKRVTLADLFLEDRDYQAVNKVLRELMDVNCVKGDIIVTNDDDKQGIEKVIMKPTSRAKSGLSKAKKLLKEDLHPVKKFNQLMKKMKKKKIHPDLERKMMNQDTHIEPSSNPTNDQNTVNNELASLLPIQDAKV